MRSPDGKDYWTTGVYREIVPLEKIVYTDSFADEKGNEVPASYYEMPGEWGKVSITIILEEIEGKTKMTLHHTCIPPGDLSNDTKAGWNELFDKLAESLK
jgi:uncharacterized protein YndB with AHSA1/START domain